VESREATIVKLQMLPQDFLIIVSRASDIRPLGFHAVHVCRRNRYAEKQLAARRAIVAVRMIRRNGALVAPEDVHLGPVHLAAELVRREQFIHDSWGVAYR